MLSYKAFGAGMPSLLLQAIGQDAATGISAAGTTQGTATALANADNLVGTVAAGSGVVLSASTTGGDEQTVYNSGANALKVYPPLNAAINQLAANAPMLLAVHTACKFKFYSPTIIAAFLSA
jgi:hypothetical protein